MTSSAFALMTALAVVALLAAEKTGRREGVWVAKPLAACGYIAVALSLGALDTRYGQWVLAALVLSWFGDVFLIPRSSKRLFRAGVLSFLLGHVAFAVAFAQQGIEKRAALVAAVIVVGVAIIVLRWLRPHVEGEMRTPVQAYVVVISTMLILATGCAFEHGRPDVFVGALLFYLSDLSVARDRFVAPGFINGAWGLPCYFAGQLVLAASVA